jgi:branched-subunit amino acid ABC-type transport system permease component
MGFLSPFLDYLTGASIGKVCLFIFIILCLNGKPNGLIPRLTRSLD